MITALALLLMGFGFVMVYAAITGQSARDELTKALGR